MISIQQLFILLLLLTPLSAKAQEQETMPQAMMIGMFHFSNPGKDVIKVDKVIDVLSDESQTYLEGFSQRITDEFNPTVVLLEYNPENDAIIQQRYQNYLAGTYELGVNEVYQIGFRVAKLSGARIASFDDRSVNWEAAPLFEMLSNGKYPKIGALTEQWFADTTAQKTYDNANLSLKEMLQKLNRHETDMANIDSYLSTNVVGAGKGFEGAKATASWWKRNFFMYAKIQSHADNDERIFVVGGQGHTAILKQLLKSDSNLEGVDVYPLLEETP